MRIKIRLHPNSSQEKIKQVSNDNWEVWIKEKAVDNKANKYLEKFLKKHFKKQAKIKSGFTSRNKVIELD